MSDINTYSAVSPFSAADKFLIVRNGQAKTLTGQQIIDMVNSEAPSQFISLEDVPGTYVGQAGKVPVVKTDESGLEFIASALAPSFLVLPDTPASYVGEALKLPRVNAAEDALEYIENSFINQSDTPAAYAGEGGKLVRVNAGGTALEFFESTNEIQNIVVVNEEADLPPVNGSGEHELAARTIYLFPKPVTIVEPHLFAVSSCRLLAQLVTGCSL
jgi:hypothetical protein